MTRKAAGPAGNPAKPSLSDERCYEAYLAKDAKFDGLFFMGVTTTGIYCRATCPSPPPRFENCRFFRTAAAAEAAGFRPCLRCRPELAPGAPANKETSAIAHRAAELLRSGEAGRSVESVARAVGVTSRQLRRIFEQTFGTTPAEYRSTCRLLLAKRLLTDTTLPVSAVALSSGFGSQRRLNDEFRARYRLSPSKLRQTASRDGAEAPAPTGTVSFRVCYRPPLQWERLLRFLSARAIPGVERVSGGTYQRSVRVVDATGEERTGWLSVANDPERACLVCRASETLAVALPQVLAIVERIFDTSCSPDAVALGLKAFFQELSGAAVDTAPGVRLAGCADPFEMTVRAVLGQQITVRAATTLAGRVASELGTPIDTPLEGVDALFPRASDLLEPDVPARLGTLGVTRQKQRAICSLARALEEGELTLGPGADPKRTRQALLGLPGIGEWTAQYLLMRTCGYPDAMPATDYAVKCAFQGLAPREIKERSLAWSPWRSYAVMYLWQS
ncbi:MAG: DNA-3-methyladenine glycosylase 2 family protein [Tractidigestivibacter sp.]|jgi:AraC family transcriptional regulator of adaptative response / DNA-3-methyladenine glycosylase II|uniref:DNA-3-methyladenine glycosylase 2 family protein n=1 Tax=Tractidigestivibacter sp. TaxID=2847320 RepID=UPI003D906158